MEIRQRPREFHDSTTCALSTSSSGVCWIYAPHRLDCRFALHKDPVADWVMITKVSNTTEHLPQLTLKVRAVKCSCHPLIYAYTQTMDGAHWPHMEFPDVFNAIMDEWLARVTFKGEINDQAQGKHAVIDEL